MPNRAYRVQMLDDMIAAVDQGFSYDGIVSVPEAGLEDVEYRSLTGSLCDGVDRVRTTSAAISRGAARVFKHKQHRHNLGHPGAREKNRSEESLAPSERSDALSEVQEETLSISNVAHAETDDLWGRLQASEQPYGAPRMGDGLDVQCGCLLSLLPSKRAFDETIRAENIRPSHHEQRKVHEQRLDEWDMVTPIKACQGEFPGENGEGWEVVQPFSMIQVELGNRAKSVFSDVDQERLPEIENGAQSVLGQRDDMDAQEKRLPRTEKEVDIDPSTVNQERLPRKKSDDESSDGNLD